MTFATANAKMDQKVFTARGLTKTYSSGEVELHALRGVDFDIRAAEVVVLLGPSGSGKSTLLNIMGGLDHATSGLCLQEVNGQRRAATGGASPHCRH